MGFFPPIIYLLSLLVKSNIGMQNIRKDGIYKQSILVLEN